MRATGSHDRCTDHRRRPPVTRPPEHDHLTLYGTLGGNHSPPKIANAERSRAPWPPPPAPPPTAATTTTASSRKFPVLPNPFPLDPGRPQSGRSSHLIRL